MAVSNDLVWSEQYELGHSRIDAQHQQLFKLYARVVEAFEDCTGSETLRPAIHALITYTRFHFHEEEALMARLGYSGLAEHRRKHQQLLEEVEAFSQELEDGKPVLIYEILSFLRNWIKNHILDEDLKLKPCLAHWE